jgi:uncharacterized membrane protein
MEHYATEIRIEAPIEHVWAFYCDTSHWADWMQGGTLSDISGPYDEVGTTYTGKVRFLGHEMKVTYKVTEVEPLKLIHERSDDGPVDTVVRFERDGGATRLIIESDYEMPAHLPGFIKELAKKGWMNRRMDSMLGDFKALAEATVPVPA